MVAGHGEHALDSDHDASRIRHGQGDRLRSRGGRRSIGQVDIEKPDTACATATLATALATCSLLLTGVAP
jgi:hypothetical protein